MKPIKRLGQNFLIDENIADRIISYAELTNQDIVLEIGPGYGILTERAAKKVSKIIGIEKDKRLVSYLRTKRIPNLVLINEDALKIEFPKFNKIVSNLPYQLSSEITFKFLNYKFDRAVLTYQKEFAERLIATPYSKAYSRLTVNLYYRAKCQILELVPRSAFHPQPKVDSAIVLLVPRKKKPFKVVNEELFFKLVNICFLYRRKKIGSSLLNNWQEFSKSKTQLKEFLSKLDTKDNRIEELEPEEIAELANKLARVYYLKH
jgi:16S rRNA (adenine1518-N6/adenine1519-N6)-dimethyltransferase